MLFPLLLLGAGVAAVLFLIPKKTSAAVLQAGKEPPSLSDQLRSKAGTTLIGAGLSGVMAAGKAAISAIFSPAAIAAVEVAPAVAATTATALAPIGVESAVAVTGGAAGATAAPAAYGAVATTGIVAAFAAPVILAMIFGAKDGARKAATAQLASRDALARFPDELAAIAVQVENAVKAKDYTAFMNSLPWGTIEAAASYGGGSTRGVDFTSYREANKAAFTPLLQVALMLAPPTLIEKLDAIGASYPGGPPVRVFSSLTEFPGIILLNLRLEMSSPGTLDQRIREAQVRLAEVPDSK